MAETINAVQKAVANKLAAVALSLAEAVLTDADELSPSAIIALLATAEAEELSIGAIAEIVGLTHSAAVRLVDRMEKDWLMRRQRRVGREVLVEITARGRRKAKSLAEARISRASGFLTGLSAQHIDSLSDVLNHITLVQKSRRPDGMRFCRVCERKLCDCPAVPDKAG